MNYSKKRQQQDLKSGRGWIYFVLGLLLALFIGGAVRVALSPKRIQNEISSRLEKAKVNVAIEGLQVSLNNGMWPRLGFFSSRMVITPKTTCEPWSEITVENLYLPLGWHHETLAFRTLEADQVQIRMREGPCAAEVAAPTETAKGAVTPTQETKTLADRWQHEVANFQKYLNRVRIHKMNILTHYGQELIFQNIDLKAETWPVQMHLDWMLSGVGWIQAILTSSEKQMELQFSSAVKEGQARGLMSLDLQAEKMNSELDIQHWPLQLLLEQARLLGKKSDFNPRSTWFSCRVKAASSWTELKKTILDFDDCSISGGLGMVRVEDLKVPMDAIEKFSPFRMVVEKLDVQHVLQSLGRTGLSGVLSEFGWLSGTLDIKNANELSWQGQLKDTVLFFSNEGQRAYQKISSVRLDAQLSGERLKAQLHDFQLDQGHIKGSLGLEMDRTARNGHVKVQLPLIELSPQVQKTMFNGLVLGLSMQGLGNIEEGSIRVWNGDLHAEKVEATYVNAQGIYLKTRFEEQKLFAQAKAKLLSVESQHSIYGKLDSAINPNREEIASVPLQFSLQDVSFNIDRTGLQWNRLTANFHTQGLSGFGFWQFDGPISGEIMMASGLKKKLKWSLRGSSQDWQLVRVGTDGSSRN